MGLDDPVVDHLGFIGPLEDHTKTLHTKTQSSPHTNEKFLRLFILSQAVNSIHIKCE